MSQLPSEMKGPAIKLANEQGKGAGLVQETASLLW